MNKTWLNILLIIGIVSIFLLSFFISPSYKGDIKANQSKQEISEKVSSASSDIEEEVQNHTTENDSAADKAVPEKETDDTNSVPDSVNEDDVEDIGAATNQDSNTSQNQSNSASGNNIQSNDGKEVAKAPSSKTTEENINSKEPNNTQKPKETDKEKETVKQTPPTNQTGESKDKTDGQTNSNGDSEPKTTTKTTTATETIPYETITVYDETLERGMSIVSVDGENGSKTITYKEIYTDGNLTAKEVISVHVTKEPINKVIKIGTKDESTKDPEDPFNPPTS